MIAKVNCSMCLVNILLDYALIYGVDFLKIPSLGITGAGLATSICAFLGCLWVFIEFLNEDQKIYPTRKLFQFRYKKLKKLLIFGFPVGLQVFLGSSGFTCFQFMIGYISTDAMTAASILITLGNLALGPIMGFCDATSILTGQYIGKKRKDIPEKIVFSVIRMIIPYFAILGIIYLVYPDILVKLFVSTKKTDTAIQYINLENVINYATILLSIAVLSNFIDAFRFVILGALRGSGDTKIILILLGSWSLGLFIPGSIILSRVLNQGIVVMWSFFVFYQFCLALSLFIRFKTGAWKKVKLIKN